MVYYNMQCPHCLAQPNTAGIITHNYGCPLKPVEQTGPVLSISTMIVDVHEYYKLKWMLSEAEKEREEARHWARKLLAALISVYNSGYKTHAAVAVANVCDEKLDRSGQLLGEIRKAARKLKGGE